MRKIIGIFTTVVLLGVACSKAPEHVISEDTMAALMADMYKAEALMDDETSMFQNDSMKMALRQSVMMKHGVTHEQFDTSLIWYAHNLEVYDKVYEEVEKLLDEEYKELSKSDFTSVATTVSGDVKPSVPRFRAVGDTADIWGRSRTWVLLPGFARNIIKYDIKPDKECMSGDRYELAFKVQNMRRSIRLFMGVDYKDGSTAYRYATVSGEGWKSYKIQSDSTREVTRIYGYMTYNSQQRQAVYVDSVELLRTHLDRSNYSALLNHQKWVGMSEKTDNEEDLQSKKKADGGNVKKIKKEDSPINTDKKSKLNEKFKELKEVDIENESATKNPRLNKVKRTSN